MKKISSLFILLFISYFSYAQTLLLTEDLETDDEGINYRSNTFNDSGSDVWERWDVTTSPSGTNGNMSNPYSGHLGNYAFGGEDLVTTDNPLGSTASCYFTLKTLDISSYANGICTLKVYLGASTSAYESDDYVKIKYAFDSDIAGGANVTDSVPKLDSLPTGAYTTIGAFYGRGSSDLYSDTNLVGVGNTGADTLKNVLEEYEYTFPVPSGVSNISIQIEARLGAGSEEVVFDHLRVYGNNATLPLLGSIAVDSTVTCNGFSNGGLSISASQGSGPYTYNWSTGASSSSINNLIAGTYTVTVTDNSGTTVTDSQILTQPTAIVANVTVDSNTSAPGASDGALSAAASGGTGLLQFNWSNGGVSNFFSQSFESTSTDNWNYVVNPATYNTEGDSVVDGSDDVWAVLREFTGDIDSASNGIHFWGGQDLNNPNGGGFFYHTVAFDPIDISTRTGVNLSFDYYTDGYDTSDSIQYQVKFDNGSNWDTTGIELIKQTNAWTNVQVMVPDSANFVRLRVQARQDGSSDFIGIDNVRLLTPESSITGLAAGTYTVSVNDANGCSANAQGTIVDPMVSLSLNVNTDNNVSCNGGADGSITAAVSGGASPYTYNWSNADTNATTSSLAAGAYSVTVTDNSGATASNSGIITEPTALTVQVSLNNSESCARNDGALNISASGGTPPYTYLWSNSATNANITNLTSGSYTISITDGNGCTSSSTFTILKDLSACGPPSNLRVFYIQDSTAQLRWDTVNNSTLYKIVWKAKGSANWTNREFKANQNGKLELSGLSPSTTYIWSVMVRYQNGNWSKLAPSNRFKTLANPCVNPSVFNVSPLQALKAKLNWNTISDAKRYRLRYRSQGASSWTNKVISNGNSFVWLTGLNSATMYEYQIKSICNFGISSGNKWSAKMNFTTDSASTAPVRLHSRQSQEAISNFNVYPNPTKGSFTLALETFDATQALRIYSLTGSLVKTVSINSNKQLIDISKLSEGIYTLQYGSTFKKLIITD